MQSFWIRQVSTVLLLFRSGRSAQDLEMYDEESDTPADVRSSNLTAELGKVPEFEKLLLAGN